MFSIEPTTVTNQIPAMKIAFKRVPAIDKCFAILDLFARIKKPLGISEICKALGFNKSTVFNMVHTLDDLGILALSNDNTLSDLHVLVALDENIFSFDQRIRSVEDSGVSD